MKRLLLLTALISGMSYADCDIDAEQIQDQIGAYGIVWTQNGLGLLDLYNDGIVDNNGICSGTGLIESLSNNKRNNVGDYQSTCSWNEGNWGNTLTC